MVICDGISYRTIGGPDLEPGVRCEREATCFYYAYNFILHHGLNIYTWGEQPSWIVVARCWVHTANTSGHTISEAEYIISKIMDQ